MSLLYQNTHGISMMLCARKRSESKVRGYKKVTVDLRVCHMVNLILSWNVRNAAYATASHASIITKPSRRRRPNARGARPCPSKHMACHAVLSRRRYGGESLGVIAASLAVVSAHRTEIIFPFGGAVCYNERVTVTESPRFGRLGDRIKFILRRRGHFFFTHAVLTRTCFSFL